MNKDGYEGKLLHDIGISITLAVLFACALMLALTDDELFTENLVMSIAAFITALLAYLQFVTLAIVLASVASVTYIGIKLFLLVSAGNSIEPSCFLWLVLPGLVVVGGVLYVKGQKKLQTENALLKRQVEELVMIDPLTNLYNLRSMFMDMQTQVSFAERNNQPISLMVIKLKYPAELKRALTQEQYEKTLIRVSKYVVDTVRLEDRVY
nr:diguanylate cyclase [Lachnospiraceae bacterium]